MFPLLWKFSTSTLFCFSLKYHNELRYIMLHRICICVCVFSHVQLFVTPWTVAHQALCRWDFPCKNTREGCHSLLQGIFPTQGSNLGLPHCRQTLYRLSHQGSPVKAEGMATPSSVLAWRIPQTQEPGGLQSMGSQRVGRDWVTNTFTFTVKC